MDFFGIGVPELILILVVVLIFFGKDRLPELAKSLGRSFKELKAGFSTSASEPTKQGDSNTKEKNDATGAGSNPQQ
ncbi:MAG: twin-arginine translocase TatA/TatE family subunit [Patescibacteria group bacterium]